MCRRVVGCSVVCYVTMIYDVCMLGFLGCGVMREVRCAGSGWGVFGVGCAGCGVF